MNVKRFPVILLVLVAVSVVLSGCASLVSSGPKSSPTPSAEVSAPAQPVSEAPDAVVEAFYTWYLDYIGGPAPDERRNPLVDGAYRSSEYLTEAWIEEVDELVATGARYDPFMCAQDTPEDVSVTEMSLSGDEAQVEVRTSFEGHSFKVLLQREDDQWKIGDVICAFANEG